ncbi:MAG: carbon monoxide dehydrogenase [Gammaproteobacteria bacterium]|nr:MAG: carbon monoxide dehydrogenase [Gammaproteobacteria bacterium]
MKIVDEVIVNASRDKVFSALNNPEVLSQVIPGCESLEKISDTEFSAVVLTKVGPIKARFKGKVELSDLVPPESYTITGQGEGGAAGIAKGSARIQLLENNSDQTTMKYIVEVDVGGKIAQAGGRLLEGVARKMSKQFFEQFDSILA